MSEHAVERESAPTTRQDLRVAPIAGPTAAQYMLALQRSAGNRAVSALLDRRNGPILARCAGRCTCGGACGEAEQLDESGRLRPLASLLQRQPVSDRFEEVDITGQPDQYMLKPPKAIHQHALTCWAAALSSFLDVVGAQQISFQDIISRYIATACIDARNTLDQTHAGDVFAEWGVQFEFFQPPHPQLTGAEWRQKLREHGHLLLASRLTMGHVVVVYGSGFDDKGAPNPNWISVMDPIVGGHRNWHVSSVANTMSLGWLTSSRKRPAACLSQPGAVPD